MIGSIIGAGMKAVGSIVGGVATSKAMKNVKGSIEQQQKDNENWFNRRYNEDATQRADAQRLLTMTEESIRNRNRQAAGSAAVMGGTEESVAAAKAANNQALADTTAQIAAAADARKDSIEATYLENKENLANKLNEMEIKKAENIAAAAKGVGDTGAQIAGLF